MGEDSEDRLDDSEEELPGCRECELYQQKIYELKARLRCTLTVRGYQETTQRLDDYVQMQI